MPFRFRPVPIAALLLLTAGFSAGQEPVDPVMIAKIRVEGLQHSQVMNYESYMTDVLGARLTLSRDMQRAQQWALETMRSLGLANVAPEPFMDFGVTWDNEFVSLHMLAPDYQPMVGYPLAHTRGTDGPQVANAVIVELQLRSDLAAYRGRLAGKAVLVTPPPPIDLAPLTNGVPRRSQANLDSLQRTVIAPTRPAPNRPPPNPELLSADEKMAFFASEGVTAVLQSESGWLGAVRGFSRPGARNDRWSRAGMLAGPVIVAITPEHYNRMYRILQRGMAVTVQVDVRNRIGEVVEQAVNITGEIPGTDLKDEIVMIGAHFDTWHASPNASDNTSGSAVVLEAARILKAVGARPRRTIRFALWSGEEQGLWGSRAYVREHFGDPRDSTSSIKPAYEKLSVYFNQDYGAGQYLGIYLQGNEAARAMLTAWMEPFRDFGMVVVSNQSVGSTDHVSFDEVGLPGFQFLQDNIPGTGGHTNLDFYDTIQAQDLMKNAVVMAAYAYNAAMAPTRVPRKAVR